MRVLVFASDLTVEASLRVAAEAGGFVSEAAPSVQEFCSLLYRDPEAIGVLASASAPFAGITVREWRDAGVTNILFVGLEPPRSIAEASALRAIVLLAGADDVQPTPIHADEFVARLQALSTRGVYRDHRRIRMPNCVYDAETRMVEGGPSRVRLSGKESSMLTALAKTPGQTFDKGELMDHIYGGEDEPDAKIVDVFICKLRRKLVQATGGLDVIRTIWGRGYQFDPEGFEPTLTSARRRMAR